MNPSRGRTAFTLIEVLVAVIVLGLLAVIAVPKYFHAVERARSIEAVSHLTHIRDAELTHQAEHGAFVEALDLPTINNGLDLNLTARDFDYKVTKTPEGFVAIATRKNPPGMDNEQRLMVAMDQTGRLLYFWPGGGIGGPPVVGGGSGGGGGGGGGLGGGGGGGLRGGGGGGGGSGGSDTSTGVSSTGGSSGGSVGGSGGGTSGSGSGGGGVSSGGGSTTGGSTGGSGGSTGGTGGSGGGGSGGGVGGGSGGSGVSGSGGGGGGAGLLTGFLATANNNLVTLGWNPPSPSILGTAIYRAISPDGPFTLIGQVARDPQINYFADFNAVNNTTYYYQVKPILPDGTLGAATSTITVTPSATAPAALKIADVFNVVLAHPSIGQSPFIEDVGGFLKARGIPMGFTSGVSSNVLGFFDPSVNAFFLNQLDFGSSVNVLASIMAHEGTHAWFHNKSFDAENATLLTHPGLAASDLHISRPPGDSIDQEYHAFMAGFRLWQQVDDGTDPNMTRVASDFLSLPEDVIKQIYVGPTYAPLGLPDF